MDKRKGISLIVLVITILVMIILAGVVVVSLQKNNPIEKAKEANFKTDVSSFASELGVGLSNSLVENSSVKPEEIFANKFVDMKKYINSFSKKYENKLVIADGKLTYIGGDSKEEKWSEECGIVVFRGVNKPVLSEGMIPIKYENNSWVICSENDPSWYNYGQKLWANVMLSDGKYKDKNLVGTSVADGDLGSMFVWIPRYAYSINKYKTEPTGTEGKTQEIHDISFLVGISNSNILGQKYDKSYDSKTIQVGNKTPKIVHPAFSFGDKDLEGIWVGKFEASMKEDENNTNGLNVSTCDFAKENSVNIVPGAVTWRYLSLGNMFENCYSMSKTGNIYGITNVDSHLIKNTEWGAVCYLTTSKYGVTPTMNNRSNKKEGTTGNDGYIIWAGGGQNSYKNNKLQSTTGNITGVYDMNGGAWEYVAAYYANQNKYLSIYGGNIFKGNILNDKYKKYFDVYTASTRETNPNLHERIYNSTASDEEYGNSYKKLISDDRFINMNTHLGDAMYEVIRNGEYSFNGKLPDGSVNWIINVNDTSARYGKSIINNDVALIGNVYNALLIRGGFWKDDLNKAGIFASHGHYGIPNCYYGFRPVITN